MALLRQSTSPSRRKTVALALLCAVSYLLYQYWRLAFIGGSYQTRVIQPDLPEAGFPKKIWYKLGAKGLSDEARNWTDTCTQQNSEWQATFLTDSSADDWVERSYASTRPDVVEVYHNISVPILKADFLRYLLLYSEGGMWSDLDVSCELPIVDWIPPQYENRTSLLVGWEFDVGWGEKFIHQLQSWTILAKPELPYMMMAIEDIMESFRKVAKKNQVAIANVTLAMVGDVVDFTGPRRFTRSVFKSLKQTMNMTDVEFRPVEESTWFIEEPTLLEDVLILPGYSFAWSMNTYEEAVLVGPPLVKHQYAGSWKNDHGGEEG